MITQEKIDKIADLVAEEAGFGKRPWAMLAEPVVHTVIMYNMFDPTDRTLADIQYQHGKKLDTYIDGLPEDCAWAVSINGKIIDKSLYATTEVNCGDYIGIVQIPTGGGGGKKGIMRMVAMLVVMVIAWYAAPLIAGAMLGTTAAAAAGTVTAAIVQGVITAVGGMIVNSLLGPSAPSKSANTNRTESASYGIDGAKNTQAEDYPLPVVYGKFRVAGNVINIHNKNEIEYETGEDGKKSVLGYYQDLFMQIALGEGQIKSISEIEINDQPTDNFEGISIVKKLGSPDQSVIGWFGDTVALRNKGITLGTDWTTHETLQEVDKLRLDFVFPRGLSNIKQSTGKSIKHSVVLEMQYRKMGDVNWTTTGAGSWSAYTDNSSDDAATGIKVKMNPRVRNGTNYNDPVAYYESRAEYRLMGTNAWKLLGASNVAVVRRFDGDGRQEWTPAPPQVTHSKVNLPQGSYEVREILGELIDKKWQYTPGSIKVTKNHRNPVRLSHDTGAIPEGYYEIRTRRIDEPANDDYTQDMVQLADVGEIVMDDVNYRNSAILGLKIKFSEQLSGRPNVTALVEGCLVDTYDQYGQFLANKYSANPAWIALDIMTHEHRGAGYALSRFDLEKWAEWAQFCDDNGLEFNGVFDYSTNIWEVVQTVCRVGRASVLNIGTRFSVIIEREDQPVMMFGVSNMEKATFSLDWLPKEDRANEFEITFADKDNNYKQSVVKLYDSDSLARGDIARPASVFLQGVTDYDIALRETWLMVAMNKYILQTASWTSPIESIACTIGDQVVVQHDMPKWGINGRLKAGSTSTVVNLDRDVILEDGVDHILLVHMSAVKRYTGIVISKTAYSITVSGLPNTPGVIKRVVTGSTDVDVSKVYGGSPYVEIVLKNTSDFSVTDVVEFWDTDVIETRNVVNSVAGAVQTVTLASPLSDAPEIYANFMFGESEKTAKPFRIIKISGDHDFSRDLTAVEYNADVYSDPENAPPPPNYSSLTSVIGQIDGLVIREELFQRGVTIGTRVFLSWEKPLESNYSGADIFIGRDGDVIRRVAEVTGGLVDYSFEADDGEELEIQILAKSVTSRASIGLAEVYSYTVLGKLLPPLSVQNFRYEISSGDVILRWDFNDEIDIEGYEIRKGASWDNYDDILTSGVSGTTFRLRTLDAGLQTYHIAAIDTLGLYSDQPTTITLQIPSPGAVRGFAVQQDGFRTSMVWRLNPAEDNVYTYEIREGKSWALGIVIGESSSSPYTFSTETASERIYWIKAVNTAGLKSEKAMFFTTELLQIPNRNVVFEQDEYADDFPGFKLNADLFVNDLLMANGATHAEYVFTADLGTEIISRNSFNRAFDAVLYNNTTWESSTLTWDDPLTGQWLSDGDVGNVLVSLEAAREVSLGENDIEQFALSGNLIGVGGTIPTLSSAVTYAPGRFANGLNAAAGTQVSWPVAIPSEFNLSFWIRPASLASVTILMLMGDIDLKLTYDNVTGELSLEDNVAAKATATGAFLIVDKPVLVAISQSATTRTVRVGTLDGEIFKGELTKAPVGPFTELRLYEA